MKKQQFIQIIKEELNSVLNEESNVGVGKKVFNAFKEFRDKIDSNLEELSKKHPGAYGKINDLFNDLKKLD